MPTLSTDPKNEGGFIKSIRLKMLKLYQTEIILLYQQLI
jgi:hypothetical protein